MSEHLLFITADAGCALQRLGEERCRWWGLSSFFTIWQIRRRWLFNQLSPPLTPAGQDAWSLWQKVLKIGSHIIQERNLKRVKVKPLILGRKVSQINYWPRCRMAALRTCQRTGKFACRLPDGINKDTPIKLVAIFSMSRITSWGLRSMYSKTAVSTFQVPADVHHIALWQLQRSPSNSFRQAKGDRMPRDIYL